MSAPRLVCLVVLLCSTLCVLTAASLTEAWKEYDFQNYDGAQNMFHEVINDPKSSSVDKIEAEVGLAMVDQYRQPGNNPSSARNQYEDILKKIDASHAATPTVTLQVGKTYMQERPSKVAEAREWFDKVVQNWPGTPEAHEATLEIAYTIVTDVSVESVNAMLDYLDRYMQQYPENELISVMLQFCSRMTFFIGDVPRAVEYCKWWDQVEPLNLREARLVKFRIARMYDQTLNEPDSAAKYYRKFLEVDTLDPKTFYCRKRIKEIEGPAQ